MSGLIGKKIGMTSLFDADGNLVACTVIEAGPNVVSHVKTPRRTATRPCNWPSASAGRRTRPRPTIGHFKKAGTTPKTKAHEFKEFDRDLKLGDTVGSGIFEEGSFVTVTGHSKGKGFQGVVKRHGFSGVGEATHGQHDRSRAPVRWVAARTPAACSRACAWRAARAVTK
jgi:large subunit ribosomal protein L3